MSDESNHLMSKYFPDGVEDAPTGSPAPTESSAATHTEDSPKPGETVQVDPSEDHTHDSAPKTSGNAPAETHSDESKPAAEPKPSNEESQAKKPADQTTDTKPKPASNKPKHNSNIDRAYKRIMEQRDAARKEAAEFRAKFQEMDEKLNKLSAPPKKEYKREDFVNDEEYFKYIARQEESRKEAEQQKLYRDQMAAQAEQAEAASETYQKIESIFPDENNRAKYTQIISHALNNGMGEALNNPVGAKLMEIVDKNPISPLIMLNFAMNPDRLLNILKMDEIDQRMELRDIEREIKSFKAAPAANSSKSNADPQHPAASSGLPGLGPIGASTSSSEDVISEEDARNFIRKYNK